MRGVLLVVAVLAVPGVARAGRTHYGWLYGTEVTPERGAELETWISEENGKEPTDIHDTTLGWSALVGVTDRLELALPLELRRRALDGAPPAFALRWYGIEARYRFVSQDPVDAPPIAPLVRVAVRRDVATRDLVRAEADLVVSFQWCRMHALIDIGGIAELGGDDSYFELRPGGGVSFALTDELRLGAEVYSELKTAGVRKSWAIAGPNLAWTHGRFWVSASYGIGLYQIENAPRVVWGILF